MTLPTFLLRLVGKSPEQVEAEQSFRTAMARLASVDDDLEELLVEIRDMDAVLQHKQEVLTKVASVAPPVGEEVASILNAVEDKPDGQICIELRPVPR